MCTQWDQWQGGERPPFCECGKVTGGYCNGTYPLQFRALFKGASDEDAQAFRWGWNHYMDGADASPASVASWCEEAYLRGYASAAWQDQQHGHPPADVVQLLLAERHPVETIMDAIRAVAARLERGVFVAPPSRTA